MAARLNRGGGERGSVARVSDPRLVLALAWVAAFSLRTGFIGLGPVLPDLAADLGLSSTAAGTLVAVPTLMMGVVAVGGGSLADRWGPTRTIALGLLLVAAAGTARATATSWLPLLALTVAFGAGIGLAQPAMPRLMRVLFPRKMGVATGIYASGMVSGSILAASLTGPVLARLGGEPDWRRPLIAWGLLAAATLAAWLALLRPWRWSGSAPIAPASASAPDLPMPQDPPPLPTASSPLAAPPIRHAAGATQSAAASPPDALTTDASRLTTRHRPTGRPADPPTPEWSPWRDRAAWVVALLFAAQGVAYYLLVAWLPAVYRELGQTPGRTAGLFALFNAVTLPAILGFPSLSDWLGTRRLPCLAASACFVAGALGLVAAPVAPVWAWAWTVLAGAGVSGLFALGLVMPADVAPAAKVGAAAGMVLAIGYAGSALGPILAGLVRDLTGGFGAALATLPALGLVMATLALLVPAPRRAGAAPPHR